MNYKILFYVGCVITAITLISTIVAFFKCNVIEIVCDLLGIKLQKKVKIKRKGNKKSKAVSTTVKVKRKDEVKIRSKREIEESQSTKSYYVGPRKDKIEGTEFKENIEDTNIISRDEYIEDTGIMEVGDTDIIDDNETSVMNIEDTCIIDEENGIEDETALISEDDETSLLGDETSLLDEEDETSLLGMGEKNSELEDGFHEKFIKEIEIIVTNSDTVI